MTNWKEYKLGDLVTFQRGHDLPRNDMKDGIYPVAGSNSIIGFHNEFTTKSPGITIGRSGNIGNPQLHKTNFWAHNTVLYVKEFKKVDPVFFYYLLKTLDFSQLNSGSAVPSLNRNFIHPFKVTVPEDLPTQTAIAEILSSLDDKIELNNKINQELENLAQTLFKQWFIDFEFPVSLNHDSLDLHDEQDLKINTKEKNQINYKNQGNQANPKNQGSDTYRSSGGEMVESELGEIPKGWEVRPIAELFDFVVGGDWGKDDIDDEHTEMNYVIRGTDIPTLKSGSKDSVPYRAIKPSKLKNRQLQVNDIIIEISGGSKDQPTGRTILITKEILERLEYNAIPASFCRLIRPKTDFAEFLGIYLTKIYNDGKTWEYQNQSTGISNFQFKFFESSELLVLPSDLRIIDEFNSLISGIYNLMTTNENQELTNLRDTLLPKLISGELEVNSLNRDFLDLLDEKDFKKNAKINQGSDNNQGNQDNPKNQG